jgi:caa(3)-type oxidase subunit IV
MNAPSSPPFKARDLMLIGLALLLLLGVSAATVALPPAPWKTGVSLVISAAKIGLIAVFFMRLNRSAGLVRVFAVAGLFWVGILATLVAADYLTR